jgi:membrane associated rhomboid family serine protease
MRFLSSHVIHFLLMGLGISVVLGMITPTTRPERTRMSILKHFGGLVGIGLVLAWVMYLLPRHPVRF